MESYAIFRVSGIDNITIAGTEHNFMLEDSDIETIELNTEDYKIRHIKTVFRNKIEISNELLATTEEWLKLFLVQLILQRGALAKGLSIKVEKVFDAKSIHVDKKYIDAISIIKFSDSCECVYSYDIEEYKNSYLDIPINCKTRDDYFILFNIMQIDNIAIRYLLMYEFLLSRVSKERKQKDVTDYINNQYNPTKSFNKIGEQPTRRPGKSFTEDELTYYRNLLAHNEGGNIEDIEKKVNLMSRAINEVIGYLLSTDR